jgi:tetratricopeptide (TPR) repeat protein
MTHRSPHACAFVRRAAASVLISSASLVAVPASAAPVTRTGEVARLASTATPAERAYARGVDAMTAGDLAAAERAFREVLKLDAKHVDAMLGLAEVAFTQRKTSVAAAQVDAALKVAPGNARALASQGRLLALSGKTAEAEAAWRQAIEADPKLIRPKMDLADLLATRRSLADATALYRQVIELDAKHAGAHYALGQTLQAQDQLDAAANAYRKAAELSPNSVLAPLALARLELGRQRAAPAMAEIDKVLRRQPKMVDALVTKGDIQELQGKPDAALQTYAEAAQLAPKTIPPLLRAAMLEHRRGQLDKAEAAYLKVLALDSQQALALNNLAAISVSRGKDLPKAEERARAAVKLAPQAMDFVDTLASAQRAQGRPQDAVQTWRRAQAQAPRNPLAMAQLGRALAESGAKDEARKWLRNAMDISTDFPGAPEARRLLESLS